MVDPDVPPCGCGDHGCLEVFSSDTGIVNRAEEILASGGSDVASSVMKGEKVTAELVFDAARRDDVVALQVVEMAGRALGRALPALGEAVRLVLPKFREDAGAIGAALLLSELSSEDQDRDA